ncbi:MAG: hypothetical protein R2728_01355 [Chitinophagales bacterium]
MRHSKGALYYYFKSKEDLMRSVLKATNVYFQNEVYLKTIESDFPSNEILNELLSKIEEKYSKMGGCIIGNTILETSSQGIFKHELSTFINDLSEVLTELYYLKLNDLDMAKTKSIATIQDIQGGLMMMRLNNEVSHLQKAIERAKK